MIHKAPTLGPNIFFRNGRGSGFSFPLCSDFRVPGLGFRVFNLSTLNPKP